MSISVNIVVYKATLDLVISMLNESGLTWSGEVVDDNESDNGGTLNAD